MKKSLLLTGIMAAAILSITACGGKATETTAAGAAAETTTEAAKDAEETTGAETSANAEETTEAEQDDTQIPIGGELPESDNRNGEPNIEPIEAVMNKADVMTFAEDIKTIVAAKDLDSLMDLCVFPVTLKLEGQEAQEVEESDTLIEMGADQLFTDKLVQAIADVDVSKITSTKDGVKLGAEAGITFTDVEGNLAVTAISQ